MTPQPKLSKLSVNASPRNVGFCTTYLRPSQALRKTWPCASVAVDGSGKPSMTTAAARNTTPAEAPPRQRRPDQGGEDMSAAVEAVSPLPKVSRDQDRKQRAGAGGAQRVGQR